MRRAKLTAIAAPALLVAALGGTAAAQDTGPAVTYGGTLTTLNDSGANGTMDLSLDGNNLTVSIESTGLSPNLPHAQHLHGALDGSARNVCPPPEADTDGDGFVSVAEGVPFYGGINVSLTTEGDTSPDSALALERFPVADGEGNLSYERTFEVSDEIAAGIGSLHVVQHGIDLDDSGAYDGDKESSIAPGVPFEATVPATCGDVELSSVDGQDVDRLAGLNRFVTAVEISQSEFPDGADTVYLSRADLFADAVAGGSLTGGPTLLVPMEGDLPGVVADEIDRLDPGTITVLGGEAAVSDDILIQAAQANN